MSVGTLGREVAGGTGGLWRGCSLRVPRVASRRITRSSFALMPTTLHFKRCRR